MNEFENQLREVFGSRLIIDELLSKHTTFRIGGPADYYLEVENPEELRTSISIAKKYLISCFVIGGGSNLLITDNGFRGLIIKNKATGIKISGFSGKYKLGDNNNKQVIIKVYSGETMNHLVRFTIEENLEGLEDFLGLPGTVGGAIAGNSHWKGKKINDYIKEIKTLNLENDKKVIISANFRLKRGNKKELWYRAEEALRFRRETQPLDFPSAGCIFKNISLQEAEKLKTPNLTKSTGYLIDQCGLKGKQIGSAQISLVHANFIINKDKARALDVIKLIKLIKEKVKNKFGISLIEEIKYVGF